MYIIILFLAILFRCKGLLHKLQQNGIFGNTLDWIGKYHTDCKQKVKLEGYSSSKQSIIAGVPHIVTRLETSTKFGFGYLRSQQRNVAQYPQCRKLTRNMSSIQNR